MTHGDAMSVRRRWVAAGEFFVGGAIVLAHNVFRAIPKEVPLLVVAGLLSARLWAGRWWLPGLARPPSWRRTVFIAFAAVVVRLFLGEFMIEPLGTLYWPPPVLPDIANGITGNATNAILLLLLVQAFAAFGEEFACRGYLLSRFAAFGGGSAAAQWAGMIVAAVLFGFGHYFKGPVGVLGSGVAGPIYGAAYIPSGQNLWAAVLGDVLVDTNRGGRVAFRAGVVIPA